MTDVNRIFTVYWTEKRKCRMHVHASDAEAACDAIYAGDMDPSDIDVLEDDITEVTSTLEEGQ